MLDRIKYALSIGVDLGKEDTQALKRRSRAYELAYYASIPLVVGIGLVGSAWGLVGWPLACYLSERGKDCDKILAARV